MSAEDAGKPARDGAAEAGGAQTGSSRDDLRAQYLPVSRKELRRRREAERKGRRGRPAAPSADSAAEEASETRADAAAAEDSGAAEETAEDREQAETSSVGSDAPDAPDSDDSENSESSESDEDEEQAPVPASRRNRHRLDEDDEQRAEVEALTAEIAAKGPKDPHEVDPELLKKQQALAARAMQANEERRRQAAEQGEAPSADQQRPESEIITSKMLRGDAADEHPEAAVAAAGEIDPVAARGAHGLEIDEMVEQTSRQAGRQSMMLWLVIVLSLLLLIAVGLVLYTVLT